MENTGIDYSLGQSNFNPETGIHYGVISQNEVLPVWADSSEPYYGKAHCPQCGNELEEPEGYHLYECFACKLAGKEVFVFDNESIWDFVDPISFFIDDDEYSAELDDYGDIFITKSPYYTTCQFCSPCAPGAGYIMNTVENGVKTYCFGHDWFDNEKAPYPVYDVKTNELVNP